jgi:pimeloyl-ACP methyl ester carboxylesterase
MAIPLLIQSTRAWGDAGPPVVLIPSLGRGAADFDDLGRRLAATGYQALGIEPPGIGRTRLAAPPASLEAYADAIAALIGLRGLAPVHIAGHALGNRVARALATRHPGLVQSLTLLAAGGQAEPDPEAAAALPLCFDETLAAEDHIAAVATAFFAPGNDASVWADGWHSNVFAWQRAAMPNTDLAALRHGGSAPMLIVQGLQDRLAVPGNGRILKRELGARVELVEVDRAGHALLPEQPERIADAVLGFIRVY